MNEYVGGLAHKFFMKRVIIIYTNKLVAASEVEIFLWGGGIPPDPLVWAY